MSSASTPFPWKGDARRSGGWPKVRGLAEGERERSQPPALCATSFQRKERKIIFPVVEKEQNRSCHPIV